jgi:multiple sugar transport system ATP-binding protein
VQYDAATRLYPGTSKAAVDELNLSITDGELLVLVGPSGSGKSTALRMLAGLEPLDAGQVLIGGKDVSAVRPRDRDIAMVFQNYALYPQLDVAANMGFALKQRGVRKEERLGASARLQLPRSRATSTEAEEPLGRPASASRNGPGDRAATTGLLDG